MSRGTFKWSLKDAVFEWLERTYREHSMSVVFFDSDPFPPRLHSDARFQGLIRKAHCQPRLNGAIRRSPDALSPHRGERLK